MICPVAEWIYIGEDKINNKYYVDKSGASNVKEDTKEVWIKEEYSKNGAQNEKNKIIELKPGNVDYDMLKNISFSQALYKIDYTNKTRMKFEIVFISYHDRNGDSLYSYSSKGELHFVPLEIQGCILNTIIRNFNLE